MLSECILLSTLYCIWIRVWTYFPQQQECNLTVQQRNDVMPHSLHPSLLHLVLFLHKSSAYVTSILTFLLLLSFLSLLLPLFLSFLFFSLLLFLFIVPFLVSPLLSVSMTHFLGPGPINHSVVGLACPPPCLAALLHHSKQLNQRGLKVPTICSHWLACHLPCLRMT